MPTTIYDAREQLSKDLGDYFASATTADGGASGATLIDDALKEQDDDRFVTQDAAVFIKGGQTNGPAADQERAISTKVSDTITPKRAFAVPASGKIVSGINYEAHRLFTAAEKDRALNVALNLCFPVLWTRVEQDITMVADQYDYDLSSYTFYNSTPHQVHLVSSGDTELTLSLFPVEMRDTKLHLNFVPIGGRKLRLFGIKIPVIGDINQPQLLILTARAAMYLYEYSIASVPTDLVGRYQNLLAAATRTYQGRVTLYMKPAPARTVFTDVYASVPRDYSWNTP